MTGAPRECRPGDLCAPGPLEHSLCGLAPEAFQTGDAEWPPLFAEPGQRVTCPICLHHIDWVRENFTGLRVAFIPARARR